MTRVKRGTTSNKARRNTLKRAKGYRFGRSTKERQAYEALAHAGKYAFAHRRDKKNDMRKLWLMRVNAALDDKGISWSKFAGQMKKKNIILNRKMLSELAGNHEDVFNKVVDFVKN